MFLPFDVRERDGRPGPPAGPATTFLVVACVTVFLSQLADFEGSVHRWGFLPGSGDLVGLLTHMFVHGGVGHLVGNMVFLYTFGASLERDLGTLRFLALYLLAGLVAVIVHATAEGLPAFRRIATERELLAHGVRNVVGASGAISGVMAGVLHFRATAPVAVWWFFPPFSFGTVLLLPAWALILMGFTGDLMDILSGAETGVAHWAHLGGALAGWVLVGVLRVGTEPLRSPEDRPGLREGAPADRVRLERARRLYLAGRLPEAWEELRRLDPERLDPDARRAAQDLALRIRARLLGI